MQGAGAAKEAIDTSERDIFDQITFRVKPIGLVIDDDPGQLIHAITVWIKETMGRSWLPEWKYLTSSSQASDIDENIKGKDFVLLDHRLQGQFPPFHTGLEIGQYISERFNELPIFFYTAGINDLKEPGTQGRVFAEEFLEFKNRPNVKVFDKGDLNPERKLDELCYRLVVVSDNLQSSVVAGSHKELKMLLEAKVESVRPYRYRLLDYDKRGSRQTLRCISDQTVGEIEVPTRYLSRLGITKQSAEIMLKIVEFSGGQVLSYMTEVPVTKQDLAPEVIHFLQTIKDEDNGL